MAATKPIYYKIWTYRRNPNNSNNPSLSQTFCLDDIPLNLCGDLLTPADTIALSQYLTRLVERHETEALFPGLDPGSCAGCDTPATQALHQLVPTLNTDSDSDRMFKKPMMSDVSDFMVPICNHGGACEEHARTLLGQRMLDGWLRERQGLEPVELRRYCQVCDMDVGLRRCSRCRLVAYARPPCLDL
ncbi:MAG: hypothetical protein M1840_005774 [Geoglossum simile]|nr:MAG: hypothetical protein M1840_005774 [Geoglossum simile]